MGLVLNALAALHAAAERVTVFIHVLSLFAVLLGLFAEATLIAAANPVTLIYQKMAMSSLTLAEVLQSRNNETKQ